MLRYAMLVASLSMVLLVSIYLILRDFLVVLGMQFLAD